MTREEREEAILFLQENRKVQIECKAMPASIIALDRAIEALKAELHYDEWCTDCKEYDHEKNCCPRFNRVIRNTVEEMKTEPCGDAISRKHLLSEIDALMQSPWFNNGKDDDTFTHYAYVERKEAVEVVRDLCVKTEPSVTPERPKGDSGQENYERGYKEGYDKGYHDGALNSKLNAPRSVIYTSDGFADGAAVYDSAECPNCGYKYELDDKDWLEKWCPHCGQFLFWEEE